MKNTKKLVGVAIFTAIVVVLQFLGAFIKFGTFSISLVLIPIVVGTALYGYKAGAWLGLVFGATVLASGDAALFLGIDVFGTIVTVLAKGVLAGLITGLVYKALEKAKANKYVSVMVSAVVCPVVNTGVFLLGCSVFFMDTIREWAGGGDVLKYMIVGLVGVNFLLELAVNVVLGPVIVRLISIGKKETK